MIKFPDVITLGDKYGPAMVIIDPGIARAYFERCVEHNMRMTPGRTHEEAENFERSNIGYWAGYYDHATRERVEQLFNCQHPVFGKARERIPTADEALAAGFMMAAGVGVGVGSESEAIEQ